MSTPSPFESARLGPVILRNRLIKAATFEGMIPRGEVSDALVGFHRRVAAGGVGMTTLAYRRDEWGGDVERRPDFPESASDECAAPSAPTWR